MLAGCSSGSALSVSKIEVTLDRASFVLLGDHGVLESSDGEKNPLAVTLKVKNVSNGPVNVSSFSDIKVYDGEEQLPVETSYDTSLGFVASQNDEIGAGKSKEVTFLFTAEKDKEYEISVTPFVMTSDKPEKEVIVKINTAEYGESFEQLNNPALALEAYIETIYMDKENEDFETLVEADDRELKDKALTVFKDELSSAFYDIDIPNVEAKKQYENYKKLLAKRAKITTTTSANANGKAVVKLEYSTIPLNNLYDPVQKYREEYLKNTGDYDGEKRDKYALTKLESIINSLQPKESDYPLEIEMVQDEDGKWSINDSHYNSAELVRIFAEGSVY